MVTTVSGLNKPASPFLPRWGGMLWFGMTAPLDIIYKAAAAAKSLQLRPTLCDPIDSSPPGSPVPGILQARTLEWVSISFSNAWKWKVKAKSLSRVQLLGTPWTAAYQAPPSMRFSRQEYWRGVPLPSPIYKAVPCKDVCVCVCVCVCLCVFRGHATERVVSKQAGICTLEAWYLCYIFGFQRSRRKPSWWTCLCWEGRRGSLAEWGWRGLEHLPGVGSAVPGFPSGDCGFFFFGGSDFLLLFSLLMRKY